MSMGHDPTGGEGISYAGSQAAEGGYKILLASLTLICVPVIIFADLLLGPFFLWAQAVSEGVPLDYLSVITPIMFSVTMTGLQYALWQTAGEGGPRWVRMVAWGLATADTLCDTGGLQWALTQDPEAGKYFWPASDLKPVFIFAMYAFSVILFFHERLLRVLLEIKQSRVNDRGEPVGFGNKYEAGVVFLSGVVLNFVDALTKILSVVCIVVLDLILTPQLVENNLPPSLDEGVLWGVSFVFTTITFLMWRWISAQGGVAEIFKRAKQFSQSPDKEQRRRYTFQRNMLYGFFFGFLVFDTVLDVMGYNQAMYGTASIVIDEFSPSWILTVLMLIVLCGMGDILFRTLFSALGDKARRMKALKEVAKGKGPKPKRRGGKKRAQDPSPRPLATGPAPGAAAQPPRDELLVPTRPTGGSGEPPPLRPGPGAGGELPRPQPRPMPQSHPQEMPSPPGMPGSPSSRPVPSWRRRPPLVDDSDSVDSSSDE